MLIKDLRQNVGQLKGLGDKACQNLSRLQITQINQLLQHYPYRYQDHTQAVSLTCVLEKLEQQPQIKEPAAQGHSENDFYFHCQAKVVEHAYIPWRSGFANQNRQNSPHAAQALKLIIDDGSGSKASLFCFGRNFMAAQLPIGSELLLAGRFQLRFNELQCSTFVYELLQKKQAGYSPPLAVESGAYNNSEFGCMLPTYPLTQGISQKQLRNAVAQALQHFSFAIEDEIPLALQQKHQLLQKKQALRQIHFPDSKESLLQAHNSLVYEELLILMLQIQRRRLRHHQELQRQNQEVLQLQDAFSESLQNGKLLAEARQCLPFELSEGQHSALAEILQSFQQKLPMNRLLQGDVGSGKTVVALLSALPWLEAGAQVVLMAPTEILAQQLLQNFEQLRMNLEQSWLQNHGSNFVQASTRSTETFGQCGFLAASVGSKQRQELLRQLRKGKIRLLVGTHALFSRVVEFANLRYIIVDEQHRFGVEQRLALRHKAAAPPHVLLMSATPIPRSLALTLYGDLDISSIRSMPAQRKVIKTHLTRQGNDQKVYQFVHQELAAGRQAYFIYPLINNSEEMGLRNIDQMQLQLQEAFSQYRLATVHGQMSQEQKNSTMEAFRTNEIQILLATTVIEVGVDVPNASVIVIEHAERFGLAQLHQLRGRVGRSSIQGYCFLVYQEPLTALAKQRVLTLKDSSDGFAIAEKDLELRGPGDLLGAEQSGTMDLRIARIPEDLQWLEQARQDADELLQADYTLLRPEHQALRQVLSSSLDGLES